MQVGILGGTFDPIHNGHLHIAEQAKDTFNLDHVILIPCFHPPHKKPHATAVDRFEMVKCAIKNHPTLSVSDLEMRRKGISYTIDTLRSLKKENPDIEFFYIVGADAFSTFQTWREWKTILTLTAIVVVSREHELVTIKDAELKKQVLLMQSKPMLVSATSIRDAVKSGKKHIDGLPACVASYIQEHHLYR